MNILSSDWFIARYDHKNQIAFRHCEHIVVTVFFPVVIHYVEK